MRLALLSAAAKESIFFIGPPGTAKSMVSRRIAAAFSDFYKDGAFGIENDSYFEYLMNEFSTPDEICGPVDLSALNETPSRYTRQTEGYLPKAKVAFLDEIWKSGPAILNTLLTIINEKKFHNGSRVEKVPLVSLASASNELPEKNRGLEALWDRFILRVFVNPVAKEDDFFKVVDDGNSSLIATTEQKSALFKIAEVESWQAEITKVELSDEAKNVITAVRQELARLNGDDKHKDDEAYYVSDRRWKKIVHILKTSAFLNGRSTVDLMDCSLIEYAIWNTDAQHKEADSIVEKILQQNGIDCATTLNDISDKIADFKKAIDTKWFNHIVVKGVEAKPAEPIIEKVDNKQCYKCRDYKGVPWFITVNSIGSNYHRIYYDNGEIYAQESSFSKNGDTITCTYKQEDSYSYLPVSITDEYTIEKTEAIAAVPAKDYFEQKLYEPLAKKTVLAAFDKAEYTPILEQLDGEITDLQSFRDENAGPFEHNAFAKQRYSGILLQKVDDAMIALKKKKSELEAQRKRYASDANIKSDFALGDIVLKDGTMKKAGTKVDGGIVAKVCLLGDSASTTYALAWYTFDKDSFEKVKMAASEFGKDLPAPYSSGWLLPTIEQWEQMYRNRDFLKGFELSGKYWSSTEDKEKGGVWYFNFDTGEKECTLPSNKYGRQIIRRLA